MNIQLVSCICPHGFLLVMLEAIAISCAYSTTKLTKRSIKVLATYLRKKDTFARN